MKMTQEKFTKEYYSLSYKQFSKKHNMAESTIARYAKKFRLSKKTGRPRKIEID